LVIADGRMKQRTPQTTKGGRRDSSEKRVKIKKQKSTNVLKTVNKKVGVSPKA